MREEENVHLLRQSGATSVITSADAAGRLLGFAVEQPEITEVLEDLMRARRDWTSPSTRSPRTRPARSRRLTSPDPWSRVARDDDLLRFDDPRAATLQAGDRIVHLRSHRR